MDQRRASTSVLSEIKLRCLSEETDVFNDAVSYKDLMASVVEKLNTNMEHWWNHVDKEIRVLGDKLFPVLLGPPHVPHDVPRDCTAAFAVAL